MSLCKLCEHNNEDLVRTFLQLEIIDDVVYEKLLVVLSKHDNHQIFNLLLMSEKVRMGQEILAKAMEKACLYVKDRDLGWVPLLDRNPSA